MQCRYVEYVRAIECVQLPEHTSEDVSWFKFFLRSRNINVFWVNGWGNGWWNLVVDNVDATWTYEASPGDWVLIHNAYILGVYANDEFNALMQDTFKEIQ